VNSVMSNSLVFHYSIHYLLTTSVLIGTAISRFGPLQNRHEYNPNTPLVRQASMKVSKSVSKANRNAFQQTYLVKPPQIDVSCRSNPDVPSYSSNTNMSSQISSMFYGVVIHRALPLST
jgi:hypothetical protein